MANNSSTAVTRLTTTVATGSPYQLDTAQLSKATTALLAHIKSHAIKKERQSSKKSLLADSDAAEDGVVAAQQGVPIWLNVGTKKHITDHTKLKPSKVVLPHSINKGDARICLITVDPQRAYKDLTSHPAFPTQIASQIGRVIGLSKLKAKYKSYESRRQLAAEYDIFMCDDRVVRLLPSILGKTFYAGNGKRPIPVNLTAGTKKPETENKPKKNKEESEVRVGTPEAVGREIENALSATVVNLSTSTNSSIKVGNTLMTAQQLDENVDAVVSKLTEKFIPKGWRGIRSLHIKGPNTMALPIWLADELWAEEGDVLEQKWTPPVRDGAPRVNEKKRRWDEWESELLDEEELSARRSRRKSKKPKALEGDKERTESISSKKSKKKLKQDALKSIQAPITAT